MPTCPVFTRAKIKSHFGILVTFPVTDGCQPVMFSTFVDFFELICTFLEEKGKIYEQLEDIRWKQDLMFFSDVMNHLQALNLSLQGKNKIV